MIISKEELEKYSDIQISVLADYLGLKMEGDDREKLLMKLEQRLSNANTVFELWEEEPPRSVQVQRIYDSQKENR